MHATKNLPVGWRPNSVMGNPIADINERPLSELPMRSANVCNFGDFDRFLTQPALALPTSFWTFRPTPKKLKADV
jgi:hypothetical protein